MGLISSEVAEIIYYYRLVSLEYIITRIKNPINSPGVTGK
jgi:hypothetical protein